MANIAPPGLNQFFTDNGAPAAGYKLYTYDAGTTTPRTTWADAGEATPNANPVVLDANGRAPIFYRGNYKLELRTAAEAVVWTVDGFNVPDPTAATSIVFANGTAAAPSIRFSQATSSGLFSPAANTFAVSLSGAELVRFTGGNVGVGTTSPSAKLHVSGTLRTSGAVTVDSGGITVTAGGVTVTAGGATITAGGLTVSAGGAAIAGNTTVSGGTFASRGFADNATAAAWNLDADGMLRNNGGTQIAFASKLTANQTSSGTIVFNSTSFTGGLNRGSMLATGTGVATVPTGKGGDYAVHACGVTYNTGAVAEWSIELRVNGTAIVTQNHRTDANVTDPWSFDFPTLSLAAGDTVSVFSGSLSAGLYVKADATFAMRQVG